jgi:hypothetical protein
MAIQILPLLGALSNVAGVAWEIYRKAAQTRELVQQNVTESALTERMASLEESSLEHARLISELSRDVEQFGAAIEVEIEAQRRRAAMVTRLLYASLVLTVSALALAIVSLLK